MLKFNIPVANIFSISFILTIISNAAADFQHFNFQNRIPVDHAYNFNPITVWLFLVISFATIMLLIIRIRNLAKKVKHYKETEENLRKSQDALNHKTAILEAQLNSSTDGVMIIDEKGNRILQNRRVAEIWKIPDQVQASSDWDSQLNYVMKLTSNPERFVDQVNYLLEHLDVISRDIYELKDGTVLERYTGPVVGKDGKIYGRIWTFHDVTEYKRVERLLAAEKELLSITLRSIGDGVITTDTDGNVLMINSVAQELTGWKSDEASGQNLNNVFKITNEMSRQPCEYPVIEVLQTGETAELTSCTVLLSKN